MNTPQLSWIGRLFAGDAVDQAIEAARKKAADAEAALAAAEAANAARADAEGTLAQIKQRLDVVESELKVRTDIMNLTSIVSEADKKGDILNVNEKFLEVSKYPKSELIGHGHNTTRHPDMPKAVFKEMWQTIGRGDIFRGVVKNRAKDGTPYYVDAVIAPILGENGKPMKYLGVRYDITVAELERQNAKGILDAIDQSYAYIEFDLGGNILGANSNFLQAVGYALEEVKGRHHRMFVDPAYANGSEYAQFWRDLNAGKAHSDTFRRVTKRGTEIWIQAVYAPVKDEMGRVAKIIKIATDVTAQVQAKHMLEQAVEEAQVVTNAAKNGDLTQRIPLDGKDGPIKSLCEGENLLI